MIKGAPPLKKNVFTKIKLGAAWVIEVILVLAQRAPFTRQHLKLPTWSIISKSVQILIRCLLSFFFGKCNLTWLIASEIYPGVCSVYILLDKKSDRLFRKRFNLSGIWESVCWNLAVLHTRI